MPGQINLDSRFGQFLYRIAKILNFQTYVEVGTWNGEGSTRCLMEGLLERSDRSRLISLESSIEFYTEAVKFWSHQMPEGREDKLLLLHGHLVEKEKLPSVEEIKAFPSFSQLHFDRWYEKDLKDYTRSPNVLDQIPQKIDVLLLDGGEYSTYQEFLLLCERTRVILCDDAKGFKCFKIRETLLSDPRWCTILDLPDERNGAFVSCRKEDRAILS